MKLGVALPIVDIGGEPAALREFAQAAEATGYHGIAAPDHVLGANVASRPGWTQPRARSTDLYHDPFVLFGFLAGCTGIGDFSTQVLILAQRQTVLVAKQAACLDVLSRRAVPARHRGRLERDRVHRAQREFPQSRPPLGGAGRGHAGVVGASRTSASKADGTRSRMPASTRCRTARRSRCGIGGHAEVTLRRVRQMGRRLDAARLPAGRGGANARLPNCARYVEEAARDPATIGIDTRVSAGAGTEAEWREEVRFWKSIGATHLTFANYYEGGHLHRIAGRSLGDHIAAMRRYWDAVADLL